MRYVLIGVDGSYQVPGGAERWLQDLGTQTPTLVPLAPMPNGLAPVAGWINPGETTLNDIGGQVLVAMGATAQDYHGPIVITGWDPVTETARGLNSDQAAVIQQHHADATAQD